MLWHSKRCFNKDSVCLYISIHLYRCVFITLSIPLSLWARGGDRAVPAPSRPQVHYGDGAAFDSSACTLDAFWQRNIIDSCHKSNISAHEAPARLGVLPLGFGDTLSWPAGLGPKSFPPSILVPCMSTGELWGLRAAP